MAEVTETVDVRVPVRTAYDQWTQFEQFPRFMQGVEQVEQLDDTHLRWVAEVGGKRKEWQAEITEQSPDQRISWIPVGGDGPAGVVTFQRLNDDATRVAVQMMWQPEGVTEKVGAAVGWDSRQVQGDLERFRDLVEEQGGADGWRGTVEQGQVTDGDETQMGEMPRRPDDPTQTPTW